MKNFCLRMMKFHYFNFISLKLVMIHWRCNVKHFLKHPLQQYLMQNHGAKCMDNIHTQYIINWLTVNLHEKLTKRYSFRSASSWQCKTICDIRNSNQASECKILILQIVQIFFHVIIIYFIFKLLFVIYFLTEKEGGIEIDLFFSPRLRKLLIPLKN